MSTAPPAARDCPRCGVRPCRVGQRLCAQCHKEYKHQWRARRAAALAPTGETGETPRERTEETAGGRETTAKRVIRPPFAGFSKRGRPGPQVPDDWPARFLDFYAEQGVRWRAAKYAGVAYDTVARAERADPVFARQVEDARQTYLDRHALNLNRLAFEKDNVVASIVALKAGRPTEYIEKSMSIGLQATTKLDPAEGDRLLRDMLGLTSPIPALEAEIVEPRPTLDPGFTTSTEGMA
jgi:hypothetical protein